MEVWIGLVSVLVGAAAGAAGTYITTKARLRLELQLAYDRALRDLRLPHYQRLFHASNSIPREWRPDEEPLRPELLRLRERFHDWFFGPEAGGLFLTATTREKYFRLQNELEVQGYAAGSESLSAEESQLLRKLASDLRHQMAQELGTAEPPQLRWTALGPTPAPPARQQSTAGGVGPLDNGMAGPNREDRDIWDDYNASQRFEHELIDRKTTWWLTSQSILFAAYGLTLSEKTDEPANFRTIIASVGVLAAISVWVGVNALIRSKRRIWKQYRDFFLTTEHRLPGPLDGEALKWGASGRTTMLTLTPDLFLPVLFACAWVLLIIFAR